MSHLQRFWFRVLLASGGWRAGLRALLLTIALLTVLALVVLPLGARAQAEFAAGLCLLGWWRHRRSPDPAVTRALIVLSLVATLRYAFWRGSQMAAVLRASGAEARQADLVFMGLLLAAEAYAFVVLVLGYFQTIFPLLREPVPLPSDPAAWPSVDVFVPTFNEPLDLVRMTVLAAQQMDWPRDRLRVYLLDDGRRPEFEAFAREAGAGYLTRIGNAHAKAGNINHALAESSGEFVAVFDCDHVPTRSFLQVTMGWFLRDSRLGLVQTPHHFYSPDPFERNLRQFRKVPNEGELFYGVVQDGNDFWNASFFCGSCAVLRRATLEEIGGIATGTVTEDAHTSLRMQKKGWNTAYLNIPQAAGLATESLAAHVRQRVRWARGMIQVLRRENPLFSRGLKLPQRLCYINAILHFLFAVPRLLFLTAPLVFLYFGRLNIPGNAFVIAAYALPHLVLAALTNSRIQGRYRHSFWNEVYETALAPYILLPTLGALLLPGLGRFNVTPKGSTVPEDYFDRRIAWPYLALLLLNLGGAALAIPRWLWWNAQQPATVAMNFVWTLYNIVILGVTLAVAWESRQRRQHVRIPVQLPAWVRVKGMPAVAGRTCDVSLGGVSLQVAAPVPDTAGPAVEFGLETPGRGLALPGELLVHRQGRLHLRFPRLTLAQQQALSRAVYARADNWLNWSEQRAPDRPLRSLGLLTILSLRGLLRTFWGMTPRWVRLAPVLVMMALLLLLLRLHAATPPAATPSFSARVRLGQMGRMGDVVLGPRHPLTRFRIALAPDHVVRQGSLRLWYQASPDARGTLTASLNGFTLRQISITGDGGTADAWQVDDAPVAGERMTGFNRLVFRWQPAPRTDGSPSEDTVRIGARSRLDLSGDVLPVAPRLDQLPAPFALPAGEQPLQATVVFRSSPDPETLQSALVLSSWLASQAGSRPIHFPVTVGRIPQGNVLVLDAGAGAPTGLNLPPLPSAARAELVLLRNPGDPASVVLVLRGDSSRDLLGLARALAAGQLNLHGSRLVWSGGLPAAAATAPEARGWLPAGLPADLTDANLFQSSAPNGSDQRRLYFHLPPGLFLGGGGTVPLRLRYRIRPLSPSDRVWLKVGLNDVWGHSQRLRLRNGTAGETVLDLPVGALEPFGNTLTLDFSGSPAAPLESRLLSGSDLDLRGLPHSVRLPDLRWLAAAGYPLSRPADLSSTAVVLPARPAPAEIQLALDWVGGVAAATGVPATGLRVVCGMDLAGVVDRNLLVIGTPAEESWLAGSLPLTITSGGVHRIRFRRRRLRWLPDWGLNRRAEAIALDHWLRRRPMPVAMVADVASPWHARRSLVVAQARDLSVLPQLDRAWQRAAARDELRGTVGLFDGAGLQGFNAGMEAYALGSLPLALRLRLLVPPGPWLPLLLALLLSLYLSAISGIWLRRRARRRLRGTGPHPQTFPA